MREGKKIGGGWMLKKRRGKIRRMERMEEKRGKKRDMEICWRFGNNEEWKEN